MYDVVGEDVLITGAGPIGLMCAAIVRQNGARNVFITDLNGHRLLMAKKMGASHTVLIPKQDIHEVMREAGMVEGFDVGLEMSGSSQALNQMLSVMRNGGKIALLGILSESAGIDLNEVIFKSLTMTGVYGRRMFETWYKMSAMIGAGLDLSPMITDRFHYTEFEKGFAAMNGGKSGKVILDWSTK